MKIESLAIICHVVNKEYCESLGDYSQPFWDKAPDWQKQSIINGVLLHLRNPNATARDSHESWLKEKTETGWKYGPVKDADKKEHPCFVSYDELPVAQQTKDSLFKETIETYRKYITEPF